MMRSALQFSGGKDSLALVYYMQALWDFVDVIFMDSGDAHPATLERVERIKQLVPHFTHLVSNAPGYRERHGDPDGATWLKCCMANIYAPMHLYVMSLGYRQVLRGTKSCDPHVHTVFPGDVVDGILFTFPLWHWSDQKVEQYLGERLPEPYRRGAVGMPDCKTCTAIEICGGTTMEKWDDDASTLGLH